MDVVLLECGFPEASRPVYKRGVGAAQVKFSYLSVCRETLASF
jgi:hypothetical protein